MELALLAALILSNLAWLLYLRDRDRREVSERDKLATRIQAPEAASFVDRDPPQASVPTWDDEAQWQAQFENAGSN